VFLTRAGQVKVLDFGIVRLRDLSTLSSLTQSGVAVGTPGYMSPEQARGLSNDVDERSDLWSCGAMMFCLLSGREVHAGGTANEQLANAMSEAAPPLGSVAPHVAEPVSRLVDRALAFSKEMRWPSAEGMQEALHQAYEVVNGRPIALAPPLTFGEGVPVRTPPPAPAGPPPDRTTSRPVASPAEPLPQASPPWLPPWRRTRNVRAVGGAAAFCAVVISVTWMIAGAHSSAQAHAASTAAPPSVCLPNTPPAAVPAVRPPAISVIDPPAASDAKPAPQPAATTRKPAPSAPMSPTTRSDCRPPYVVDADTGKKHWKLDCL